MNPIAKKLLYSSLGGAAPGALIGAAVSDEDNRLRNALIGAGLGGTAGAGIYSAKRLGDVRELNKALDASKGELESTIKHTTLDDLDDLQGQVVTRDRIYGHDSVPLRKGGGDPRKYKHTGNTEYRLVDEAGKEARHYSGEMPFTDSASLFARKKGTKGNINIQYNPNTGRTHFYVSDSLGREDRVGTLIREGLEFNLPGDSRRLANSIDQETLDSFMERISRERELADIRDIQGVLHDDFKDLYRNQKDLLGSEEAKSLFSGGRGLTTRKIVDLSPTLNQGRKATFFSDGASPDFSGPVTFWASDRDPLVLRLEKRSSLKLRGKARLKQALIKAARARSR
jgi:hypothetical protein